MWRTVATSAVSLIVIVFVPITLFALMVPINDYEAQGMSGLADCDGPGAVMVIIGPCLAVYAAGAIYYALLLKGQRRSVLVALCAMMMVVAGGKAWAAYRETTKPMHQRHCGEVR
jgi:membrane protein implicated in regulation of membrane protease activity